MIWLAEMARRPSATTAGFTLLEMLVVVAILAFALILVVGYKPPWSRGLALDTAAAEVASQLRLARSEALAQNRAVAWQVDLARNWYRVGSGRPVALPPALSIRLVTLADERQGPAVGMIRFNPDGSSTGGRVVLAAGQRRVAVGVDWLTGRVRIADVP